MCPLWAFSLSRSGSARFGSRFGSFLGGSPSGRARAVSSTLLIGLGAELLRRRPFKPSLRSVRSLRPVVANPSRAIPVFHRADRFRCSGGSIFRASRVRLLRAAVVFLVSVSLFASRLVTSCQVARILRYLIFSCALLHIDLGRGSAKGMPTPPHGG